MKKLLCIRNLVLSVLLLAAVLALGSCGRKKSSPASTTAGAFGGSSAELSETALTNFFSKIAAGNYVMEFKDHVKISVVSEDLVVYEYGEDYGIGFGDGIAYYEMAIATVNGRETFNLFYGERGAKQVFFSGEGKARELTSAGKGSQYVATRLPDYWNDPAVAEGNIWNLFTNDPENPYRFVATDYAGVMADSMQIIAGIGDNAMGRMQEIYLELNGSDPTEAHLKTSFASGLTPIPDVDITITFGGATAEARASAWMNDPDREVPAAKTGWTQTDGMNLNAVFLPDYGMTAVPFPCFATYAFVLDITRILSDDEVTLRDCRATERDLQDYIGQLTAAGFAPVEGSGGGIYRKMLREDYHCSSELALQYDGGVTVVARKSYDFPTCEGLAAINGKITPLGYPALPENAALSDFSGVDRAYELIESWLYFFDYDADLYVSFRYDDRAAAEEYLSAYIAALEEAGFALAYNEEEENYGAFDPDGVGASRPEVGRAALLTYLPDEDNYYKRRSATGLQTFRFRFGEGGVDLLFKSEKYVLADECESRTAAAGFPAFDVPDGNYESARDLRRFQKVMYGKDLSLCLGVSLSFEKAPDAAESATARAFLDGLFDGTLIPAGFAPATPDDDVTVNKPYKFFRDETVDNSTVRYIVGLDYSDDLTIVNLEFRVEERAQE